MKAMGYVTVTAEGIAERDRTSRSYKAGSMEDHALPHQYRDWRGRILPGCLCNFDFGRDSSRAGGALISSWRFFHRFVIADERASERAFGSSEHYSAKSIGFPAQLLTPISIFSYFASADRPKEYLLCTAQYW